jgi:cell wall-associated NlpC family hydrolase
MKYLKYFQSQKYNREQNNCWDFVRKIYKDEQGKELPELPIMTDEESVTFLKSNINYKVIQEPKEGCLIFFQIGKINHIGYCINKKEFIHKNKIGANIERIPKKAIFYEVIIND